MTVEFTEYSRIFQTNRPVTICIPDPDGTINQESGVIHSLIHDLAVIQLSGEHTHKVSSLPVGSQFEIRGGGNKTGRRCRGLLLEFTDNRNLIVRLIGEVISEELREFFRIDVFLPLKYSPISETNPESIMKKWELQKELFSFSTINQVHKDIFPVAANISGGGLRAALPEMLAKGSFILLELYLPLLPVQVLHIVGQIIQSDPDEFVGDPEPTYTTSISFFLIEERDRDALIHYIYRIQQQRLREINRAYHTKYQTEFDNHHTPTGRQRWTIKKLFFIFILCCATVLFIKGLLLYHAHPIRSEIQDVFETNLKKYMDKFKK